MKTKTLVIAAVLIAATAAVALAPSLAMQKALAAPNGDQIVTCTHNGNGADRCGPGQSSTETTCTKTKGKYVCTQTG